MAGPGNTMPKDPSKRARSNKDVPHTTTLKFEQAEQPRLSESYDWPTPTREWWSMWAGSPQAEFFTVTDWAFLLDTALVHAELWAGNIAAAAELRLRVAKFGATPEDRARLRMQFADADKADGGQPQQTSAKERYGNLKVLPGGSPK